MVVRVCACSNHLDLVFAAIDGPILASSANNLDLFEQVSLIPAELYLSDFVLLVKVDEVSLHLSAEISEEVESTYHGQGSRPVNNETVETW